MYPRLGVNLDHVATLRQLRGTPYPGLIEAANLAILGGADQITVHLREDRRHIQNQDVKNLRAQLKEPYLLNLEMAASPEMIRFASTVKPNWVCLVPEKRKELTTEGGLDLLKLHKKISAAIAQLKKNQIKVSLFVEPNLKILKISQEMGADAIELHTGAYCLATQVASGKRSPQKIHKELERLKKAAQFAQSHGVTPHAGHGLDDKNIRALAELEYSDRTPLIAEYNIGHFIVCRSVAVGMERAVKEMVSAIRAP